MPACCRLHLTQETKSLTLPETNETSDEATIPDFAAMAPSQLAAHSLDEMFDLSKRQLETAAASEERFRASFASEIQREASLKSATNLTSRTPVAIYARFSSEMQNPLSIEDQFSECRRYCELMGYEPIVLASDAAKTGQSLAGRDGWERVERAIQNGIVCIVVAESLDRVARDPIDLLTVMENMRRLGATIDTPPTGKASELQGLLHSIYNSIFRASLVQKVQRGMRGAVERGRHPGGTNYALRKKRGATEAEDEYLPYEPEAKIYFRIMWEIGVLKRSYNQIAFDLNAEGIPAPRGGLWTQQNFVNPTGLGGLAVNPRCMGIIQWSKASYRKDRLTKKVIVTMNPRSEWVIGFNPRHAIIPPWLFDLVQEEVALRRVGPTGPRAAPPRRLLTNLLKCGICGKGMHIFAGDRKNRPRVGCSTYRRRGDCSNGRTFYLDTVEKMAANSLHRFLSSEEMLKENFDSAVKEIELYRDKLSKELAQKEAEKASMKPDAERFLRSLVQGQMAPELLARTMEDFVRPIFAKADQIDQRIREIQAMLASDRLKPSKVADARELFASLETLLEKTGGSGLPRDLIDAAQAIISQVQLIPSTDPAIRHFDLKINGKFDAMLGDDYIGALAVMNSADYKNAALAGSHHSDKLITGKPFFLTISSRERAVNVDEEVRDVRLKSMRRIKNPKARLAKESSVSPEEATVAG